MASEAAFSEFASVHLALSEAVTGLTDEQFRRRPGGDGWSVIEILAHVAGARRRAIQRVMTASGGTAESPQPISTTDRQEEALMGRRMAPPQVIHDLIGSYRRLATLFGQEEADAAPGTVPTLSAQDALHDQALHEAEHIAQIWGLRSTLLVDLPLTERAG